MITQNIRFGVLESKLFLTLEGRDQYIFNVNDAAAILAGISRQSVRNLLSRLMGKKRIRQLERGKYILIPARAGLEAYWQEHEFAIPSILVDKYYISFWTALNYWEMSEQVPATVFVCITKRKKKMQFGGTTFKFVTISEKNFFGFEKIKFGSHTINISSREKTLLDCLAHPEYCGGIKEVAAGIYSEKENLDWERLRDYLYKIGNSAVERRLGFVLNVLGLENKLAREFAEKKYTDYRIFDPTAQGCDVSGCTGSKKFSVKIPAIESKGVVNVLEKVLKVCNNCAEDYRRTRPQAIIETLLNKKFGLLVNVSEDELKEGI